jgi:hypothetical protein
LQIGSFRTPHGIGIDLWGFDADRDRIEVDQQLEQVEGSNESQSVSLNPAADEGRDIDENQLNIFAEDSPGVLNSSADALVEQLSDGCESSELEYEPEGES